MAALTAPVMLAGMMMSAGATIAQGEVQNTMAQFQARQLEQKALADTAESQIVARQERKKAELMSSRVQALTGKSGTGYDSPNVINAMADIDARGSYNSLAALYSGASSARSRRLAASMALMEGQHNRTQSYARAGSTILTSGSSLMETYG